MSDESTSLLLRLPTALKAELQREAFAQRRSLTAEVVLRLEDSMAKPAPAEAPAANEPSPAYKGKVNTTEAAMLAVFRKMTPQQQLALLTLLK